MINSPAFDRFAQNWGESLRAGLVAAAYAYAMPVKSRLMEGYTTGDFSHGGAGVAGTVTVGEVTSAARGLGIAVGTNVPYAAYWEYGHMNAFTRRYERVEVWRETFEAVGTEMEEAFTVAFVRAMETGRPTPQVQFFLGESPYQGPNPASGFGGYQAGSGLKR